MEKGWFKLKNKVIKPQRRLVNEFFQLRRNGEYDEARSLVSSIALSLDARESLAADSKTIDAYRQKVNLLLGQLEIQQSDLAPTVAPKKPSVFGMSARKTPKDIKAKATDAPQGRQSNFRGGTTTWGILIGAAGVLFVIGIAIMRDPKKAKNKIKAAKKSDEKLIAREVDFVAGSFSQFFYDELREMGLFQKPQVHLELKPELLDQLDQQLAPLVNQLKNDLDKNETRSVLKQHFVRFQGLINELKSDEPNPDQQSLIQAYREVLEILKRSGDLVKSDKDQTRPAAA